MKQLQTITSMLAMLLLVSHASADEQGPWTRHTIDNSSIGADGVRLADINGDGRLDIVTGWEEGGVVRLYLNPGPEKAKEKWPAVTVGKVNNVEDAVMVDLDGDGTMDVVSSCEGKTKTMYVHWGPKDKAKLLDEDAWVTEAIPATVGKQMWMYCLPMDVNNNGRVDLVTGSKGKGAAVGWLESPENPRDLKAWKYHKIRDAGWIMSLEPGELRMTKERFVFVTDRKGPAQGVSLLYLDEGKLRANDIALDGAEYMFACSNPFGLAWWVATRDGLIRSVTLDGRVGIKDQDRVVVQDIPNPFSIRNGKAVILGKIDNDRFHDIVVSFNTQGTQGKPGVAWIKPQPGVERDQWPVFDISGPEGKKFDRIELIDLDGDGDLDVLTCEEADNLGVIWYENPYGSAEKK